MEFVPKIEPAKLPSAYADHQPNAQHHCPVCGAPQGTLVAGPYTCKNELCKREFLVEQA